MAKLMAQSAGKAALRLAVAIGRDAQPAALDRFIGDPSVPVLVADSTGDIANRSVATSLAISPLSQVGADRGALARLWRFRITSMIMGYQIHGTEPVV